MTFDCCAMKKEAQITTTPRYTTNYSARFLNWWQASSFSRHRSMHIPSTSPVIIQQNGTMATEFSTDGNMVDVLHYDSQKREGRPERGVSFTCPSGYDEDPLLLFDGPNKQNMFVHVRVDRFSQSPTIYLFPAQKDSTNHQSYNEQETKKFAILPNQPHEITAVSLDSGEDIIACCLAKTENNKDTQSPQLLIIDARDNKKEQLYVTLPVALKKILFLAFYLGTHSNGNHKYFITGLSDDNYAYSINSLESGRVTYQKRIDLPIIDATYDETCKKWAVISRDGKVFTGPSLLESELKYIHTISPAEAAFVKRISYSDDICNIILNTPTAKQILQCRSDYNWKHLVLPVFFVCGLGLFLYLYFCGER